MRLPVLMLTAAVVATACTDRSVVAPPNAAAPAFSKSLTAAPAAPWAAIINGETGPGSLYALYIPQSWNGDAVYYAHGVRSPFDPISLDDTQDDFGKVRDALGAEGYAFVYSSFSQNGLAIKDGAQRTHQLRGLLSAQLGGQRPKHNYLAGYSLGALVGLDLAEHFPDQYDGLLAMCGMVGGTPLQVQFIGDVRALFDYFYPGVLPGTVVNAPSTPPTLEEVQALVVGAITPTAQNPTAPFGLFAIASTAQTPLGFVPGDVTTPGTAQQTLVQSLVVALYYQLNGAASLQGLTHGHTPYDNRHQKYTLGTSVLPDPTMTELLRAMIAGADAGVTRYDMPPDARNYLEQYYQPTGNLKIPVVSVHNDWDYLVPFMHEGAFASLVQSAGAESMLWQRGVQNYGHCNFSTSEVVSDFQKLVDWVATGVKPTS